MLVFQIYPHVGKALQGEMSETGPGHPPFAGAFLFVAAALPYALRAAR
jgi:hypothetical protein